MELQRDFYVGVVEDNKDPNRKGRIKVRVQTLYHNLSIEDIPYAHPFASLAGKEFEIPAIGKLVNVLFLSDDLYSPYYIFSENYNTNLKNKLKSLSDEEYVNFVALLFDERTNIFADSKELTIDHLFNKITINNDSINHELKDNSQILNLGSKNSDQDAVLGTNFFEWMDKFINALVLPSSLIGNMGAPVLKPQLNRLCNEYIKIRSQAKRYSKGGFVSKNVKIVENTMVKKLERNPSTVYEKNDTDLVLLIDDQTQQCQEQLKQEQKELQDLEKTIKKENKKSCKQGRSTKPTETITSDEEMQIPLVGTRISSRFGLRVDPKNPNKIEGHNGIDIAAPIGTPIVSPANGRVISAAYFLKGGNSVRILHDNGFITGFAHLKDVYVKNGQPVTKGQEIGTVGNTGVHTTGPHLHFTVTTPSQGKVDPEQYFTWPDTTESKNNTKQYQGQEYQEKNEDCIQNESTDQGATEKIESENDLNTEGDPITSELENASFEQMTELVIDKLEGGYYHPNMLKDGRIKDSRYLSSGETMFGIDRKNGGSINTSPAGVKFWNIIDESDASDNWKWLYRGGEKEQELKGLVVEMMKPKYDEYSRRYLSPEALQIVNSNNKLLFNFIYAVWNGPGWFQRFAEPINAAVARGITDPNTLTNIALERRMSSTNSLIAQGGGKISGIFDNLV